MLNNNKHKQAHCYQLGYTPSISSLTEGQQVIQLLGVLYGRGNTECLAYEIKIQSMQSRQINNYLLAMNTFQRQMQKSLFLGAQAFPSILYTDSGKVLSSVQDSFFFRTLFYFH